MQTLMGPLVSFQGIRFYEMHLLYKQICQLYVFINKHKICLLLLNYEYINRIFNVFPFQSISHSPCFTVGIIFLHSKVKSQGFIYKIILKCTMDTKKSKSVNEGSLLEYYYGHPECHKL